MSAKATLPHPAGVFMTIPPARPGCSLPISKYLLQRTVHVAGSASRRRNVGLQRVIHHHAIGAEPPAQSSYRPFHAPKPAARQAVAVALVVKRHDLVQKHLVKRF